jgi:hypothetical protein
MDTMWTPCCMGLTAFRFAPRNSARAWAAGDSAGDGWGQPELSVLVVGVQIASADARKLGTALGTDGAGHGQEQQHGTGAWDRSMGQEHGKGQVHSGGMVTVQRRQGVAVHSSAYAATCHAGAQC